MITVITAVYNGVSSIAECLDSVAAQDLPGVEQLVLDANSTDGTTDVIRQQAKPHVRHVCERDSGLYDALNKGVRLAKHDIIGLLHADDMYASPHVLSHVASAFRVDPTLEGVYGDLVYVSAEEPAKIVRYWKAGQYRRGLFFRGWMPPHPTLFLRRSVYERVGGFRTDLNIAADYEFVLRAMHIHDVKVAYIPEVFTRMRLGGMSNRNLKNVVLKTRQDLRAWQINGQAGRGFGAVALKNVTKLPQFLQRPKKRA